MKSPVLFSRKRFFGFKALWIFAFLLVPLACEDEGIRDLHVIDPSDATRNFDIIIVSGNNQTGVIGDTLADSLVMYVTEDHVSAKSWNVDYRVIQGEGIFSPSTSITDLQGHTATTYIPLGSAGVHKLEAKPQLGEESVIFTVNCDY